jgi:shikimate dehydrogenase
MRVITGQCRVAGVIGDPVGHSLSPALHHFWLEREKIDGAYIPIPIRHDHFAETFPKLKDMGLRGCNVTIPYKQEVMRFLDEVDAVAEAIGAVNTIEFKDGRALGTNTDTYGFSRSLQRAGVWNENPKVALILGAGGASKAVIHACKKANMEVHVTNRTQAKAKEIARKFDVETIPWDQKESFLNKVDLLINTTSLGMAGQPEMVMDMQTLNRKSWVTDIVYHPLKTSLLKAAEAQGCRTIHGLGMLLFQAQEGFRRWYGTRPEVDEASFLHVKTQLESMR